MEPFRPIEANNNGQMVPEAESIWEGNYTNASVARNAKQMLTTKTGWKEYFMTSTSCVDLLSFYLKRHHFTGGKASTKWLTKCINGSNKVNGKHAMQMKQWCTFAGNCQNTAGAKRQYPVKCASKTSPFHEL